MPRDSPEVSPEDLVTLDLLMPPCTPKNPCLLSAGAEPRRHHLCHCHHHPAPLRALTLLRVLGDICRSKMNHCGLWDRVYVICLRGEGE